MEEITFIKKFQNCVKEYRKLQKETDGTDEEIAHFFSINNVKFLKDNIKEIKALSACNCERPFMTFVTHYIYY